MAPEPVPLEEARRLELHTLFESLVPEGVEVYFQEPSKETMIYPCIRYDMDMEKSQFADGFPYRNTRRYQVTVIDRNPDSPIPAKVKALPMSMFSRKYRVDGLHHFVYNIYF